MRRQFNSRNDPVKQNLFIWTISVVLTFKVVHPTHTHFWNYACDDGVIAKTFSGIVFQNTFQSLSGVAGCQQIFVNFKIFFNFGSSQRSEGPSLSLLGALLIFVTRNFVNSNASVFSFPSLLRESTALSSYLYSLPLSVTNLIFDLNAPLYSYLHPTSCAIVHIF